MFWNKWKWFKNHIYMHWVSDKYVYFIECNKKRIDLNAHCGVYEIFTFVLFWIIWIGRADRNIFENIYLSHTGIEFVYLSIIMFRYWAYFNSSCKVKMYYLYRYFKNLWVSIHFHLNAIIKTIKNYRMNFHSNFYFFI